MSSNSIYDLHRAAFARVSAYVILNGAGERVATIAFKFPADGAGRLWAYVHWMGVPMVRGFAAGGGYDKQSAACAAAVRKITLGNGKYADGTPHHDDNEQKLFASFNAELSRDDGFAWDRRLKDAGFQVCQAV